MDNKKPILVILAAGMASRYGSAKQVDGFGPNGERIIEYSIYDAIKAGFGKIVFVIREEFEAVMREAFEEKLNGRVEVAYAYQNHDLSKFGVERKVEREKPWGTGHAVMSAKEHLDRPFCVINADDFYGYDAFAKMAEFLQTEATDKQMSLVGFEVGKTLSEHGYVSRGVCDVTADGLMNSVTERTNIYRKEGSEVEGSIVYHEEGMEYPLHPQSRVSMNFWGFTPKLLDVAESLFPDFVEENYTNPKSEFFIPTIPDYMVKNGLADFKVLPTASSWFGVTYKEDKEAVQKSLDQLVKDGVYPKSLWGQEEIN